MSGEASDQPWTCPNSGEKYTAAQLAELLESRDRFLAERGLFTEYADSLSASPAHPKGEEGGSSANAILGPTPKSADTGACSTCGAAGFTERASGPEQRWACPECEARKSADTEAEPSAATERLRAARAAYPQGHSGDDVGRLMVRVRAADIDAMLVGIRNYELTMQVMADPQQLRPAGEGETSGAVFEWPALETLIFPRDPEKREPHPVLDALAEYAAPWNLQSVARSLRQSGVAIPTRAEAEYAAAAYFLIGHALRSGKEWREAAIADLRQRRAAAPLPEAPTPPGEGSSA